MLAYVFWHAPCSGVEPRAYAVSLDRFHAVLAADPPAGFLGSFTTCATRVPWLEADTVHEDWYLVADSAALDPLDAAAVDARRRGAHDAAARAAGVGAGGLYRLARGSPIVPVATDWFAKPAGTTYAAFAGVLDAAARAGATVWQRQMVLGPAPEFAAQYERAGPVAGDLEAFRTTHVRAPDSRI